MPAKRSSKKATKANKPRLAPVRETNLPLVAVLVVVGIVLLYLFLHTTSVQYLAYPGK